MMTSSCPSQRNRLENLSEKDLRKLEKKWIREGKNPSDKRYLRYYYRNRHRLLADKSLATRNKKDNAIENVCMRSGLIS